jgi:hypothetical protein
MQSDQAAENLLVIRTLMERSALYRRALAPVMLCAGLMGVAGWGLGTCFDLSNGRTFCKLWFLTAALTIALALMIIRRQALRSAEPFWTSPTKRVVSAMLPPLVAGFCLSLISTLEPDVSISAGLPATWALLYGTALHSAGFFISRGVRWLGWLFIIAGCAVSYAEMGLMPDDWADDGRVPNAIMGVTFGALHLLAAAYLFITEKPAKAA